MDVITLYGFGSIFADGRGETKDLWVQWALEELDLPYRIHALDHSGGELDSEAYGRLSCFHQAPVIDDDGFVLSESAAIVLYLAEKAGKFSPGDKQGRMRVVQWCFAAVGTLYPILSGRDLVEMFDSEGSCPKLHGEVRKVAERMLLGVERRLSESTWIANADFTVADVMMAGVLRMIRKTDLLAPLPEVKRYYDRCFARPAWQRTLASAAERLGTSVAAIQ
jgi:glutathione S-transferase